MCPSDREDGQQTAAVMALGLSAAAPAVPDSNGHRQAERGQMRTLR